MKSFWDRIIDTIAMSRILTFLVSTIIGTLAGVAWAVLMYYLRYGHL